MTDFYGYLRDFPLRSAKNSSTRIVAQRRLTKVARWKMHTACIEEAVLRIHEKFPLCIGQIRLVKKELENPMRCRIGRHPTRLLDEGGR